MASPLFQMSAAIDALRQADRAVENGHVVRVEPKQEAVRLHDGGRLFADRHAIGAGLFGAQPLHQRRVDVVHSDQVVVGEEGGVGPDDVVEADEMRAFQRMDGALAESIARVIALVVRHHAHDAGRRRGVNQFVRFGQVVAHGLLDEDVLAHVGRVDGRAGMVARKHEDGVYVGFVEHLPVVGVGIRDAVLARPRRVRRAGRQIAQRSHLEEIGQFVEMGQMHDLRDHACADEADAYYGI